MATVSALILFAGVAIQDPTCAFTLRLDDPQPAVIHASARVDGLDSDERTLECSMVERYAFARLEPRFETLPKARDSAGRPLDIERLGPFRWQVATRGESSIELDWSVALDHRQQIGVAGRDEYEFPYAAEDHAMLVTGALLLVPELERLDEFAVKIAAPDGWSVKAPWPETAPGQFAVSGRRALVSNLVALGDWDSTKIAVDGSTVSILFAPGQQLLADRVVPRIKRLLRAELELFASQPFDTYLILFGRPDGQGLGGSPKQGSMTLYAEPRLVGAEADAKLSHLVAHEFFHTWGQARYDAPDELRFFNEGFTDYFAYYLLADTEVTTWSEFTEQLAAKCVDWETSRTAQKGLSLVDAGGPAFFAGRGAYRLVYSGGAVVAALSDLAIRKARPGATLADMMRDFNNDPRWSRSAAPTWLDLRAALAAYVGDESASLLLDLTRADSPPDMVAAFAAQGVELDRSMQAPEMDLRANLRETTIGNLDPAGLAARVGLEQGDQLLVINGEVVVTEGDVRRLWGVARDRLVVSYRRDGTAHELDVAVPEDVRYRFVSTDPFSGG